MSLPHTGSMLFRRIFLLLSVACMSVCTHSIVFAINGEQLLSGVLSKQTITSPLPARVLYKGIRPTTPRYQLLQRAIAAHLIDNTASFIPLSNAFTPASLQSFVRDYMGMSIDIDPYDPLDADSVEVIISQLQDALLKKQALIATQIQDQIIQQINTQYSGTTTTGNIDHLIRSLNDPYSEHLTGSDNTLFHTIIDGRTGDITIQTLGTGTILLDIRSFAIGSYPTIKKLFPTLQSASTLIIDLRHNGGGSLDDTLSILDHIVPVRKRIISIQDRTSHKITHHRSQGRRPQIKPQSFIILVDRYTASAAEIFAGVIKEYYPDTVIVGESSFGKGSIQTVRNYTDGSTIKITTAHRLLGKSQTSLDGKGIQPDIILIDDPLTPQDEVIDYIRTKN